jgi:predicted pyridoxine 5'-phosphate oxidase superfamily flavin-nucleotide-binding protein
MSDDRLKQAQNVWVATVRPNGRPHLVPIWFVEWDGSWYFVTDPRSVKARNLQHNPRICLALEDGSQPYIVEGEACPISPSADVIRLFKEKYDWDITDDATYSQMFEVRVNRKVM